MRIGASAFEDYESEGVLERKCRKLCRSRGYHFTKQTGESGDTDRIITSTKIAPRCMFVECKVKGKPLKPLQLKRCLQRIKRGYFTLVCDDVSQLAELLDYCDEHGKPPKAAKTKTAAKGQAKR